MNTVHSFTLWGKKFLPPWYALFLLLFFPGQVLPLWGVEAPEKLSLSWDLLWTGYWYNSFNTLEENFPTGEDLFEDGTLFNRGDLSLGLPWQDLSLRFMATDKRRLPSREVNTLAGFNPALGFYHPPSGSRLLWGVMAEEGLSARINNVWSRAIPFMESRRPSTRDLKTEPAARDRAETYLHASLPQDLLPGLGGFASAAWDEEKNPALGGGLSWNRDLLRTSLEGFYTQKELPERRATSWFSSTPSLPARDFRIYALGFLFDAPLLGLAADWALSETFGWGRGGYGNFSLRLGSRPWRFSLGLDGASDRFSDRSGHTAGPGLRIAGRLEHLRPRTGLFRIQGSVRAAASDEAFSRSSLSLYYRPSSPRAADIRAGLPFFRFSRASLEFNRDARRLDRTSDSLSALGAIMAGPLSIVLSGTYQAWSVLELEEEGAFQGPYFEAYESFKLSGELGFSRGIFSIQARGGCLFRAERENIKDLSVNVSFRPGSWGRISMRLASTELPRKWNYTLSWRYALGGRGEL